MEKVYNNQQKGFRCMEVNNTIINELSDIFCNSAWILQTLPGDRDNCIEVIFDCDTVNIDGKTYQIRIETPYFDNIPLSNKLEFDKGKIAKFSDISVYEVIDDGVEMNEIDRIELWESDKAENIINKIEQLINEYNEQWD